MLQRRQCVASNTRPHRRFSDRPASALPGNLDSFGNLPNAGRDFSGRGLKWHYIVL
jgi:hypothetical protein